MRLVLRDVRTSSIYYGLTDSSKIKLQDSDKFRWHSVYELPELAFDHKSIIESAISRLRKKVVESDFAFQLMPEEFTLAELQKAYEVILHELQDKCNFRKKLLEMKILRSLRKKKMERAHRLAELYCFIRKK